MDQAISKVDQFAALVASHDLNYTYSDDGRVHSKGLAERNAIEALAREIPREQAVAIWNAHVEKKMGAWGGDYRWAA